ncbi:ISAs1 family transposase [Reichenbachiella sp. ABR2-5]|uniref:ISAs1 family transposase n=2 Tax=Reichenbachiella ulvae TaxID=2980104 RepID=A0ABT3CVJ7_9BACT|nr:ISAs1 family transposase [Reichenbachiella ulvae]MCV9385456.1 ISAs1 family transposase [Reichenbachiella ulvae]MCV9386298.1 ISAs1 family transposase [Reichenbachiella ulvae]MCV9386438.1 ISAs1 family transposase [Reichenbachiella ulvae]MCV9387510.1 ISAs1 family transposase [Reichenbachiella ulvae]MCV9388652.1 ISAs1 family transposase [Reichenbachiella ulvae]
MASESIIWYLGKVKDHRRGAGQRHSLELVLVIVLMSVMSGYYGYRAIGDFIERNRENLLSTFQPKQDRLPTFYTIRRVLMGLDFDSFSHQFYQWSKAYVSIESGEWLSVDGKAIGGTMSDYSKSYQNFINLVTVFVSRQKMVLANGEVINSKESEIPVVRQLIEMLDLKDVVFTMDALHCQKKR